MKCILKINFTCLLLSYNVAIRKNRLPYGLAFVACIIVPWKSVGLLALISGF